MSSYFMEEYHFWTLMGGSQTARRTLSYNRDGYTIVMSKGEIDGSDGGRSGYLTEDAAESEMNATQFTLTVNEEAVAGDDVGEKHVEQLDDDYWHIVQDFHIDVEKGKTYIIKGKTTQGGDFVAEGTLKLKITSWLIF